MWCSKCRGSLLVAFSCHGRSFCPSCERKKQLLWAEWLRDDLLASVPHRHMVLTIPRLLRPLLRRRRDLLTELARAGAEATVELVRVRPEATSAPASLPRSPPRETSCSVRVHAHVAGWDSHRSWASKSQKPQ